MLPSMLFKPFDTAGNAPADGVAARPVKEWRILTAARKSSSIPLSASQSIHAKDDTSLICSSWLALKGLLAMRGADARIIGVGVLNQRELPLS